MIRSVLKYFLFFATIFFSVNLTNAQFENYNPIVTNASKYQTQGFVSFQENFGKVDFVCANQCFILLDKLGSNDYLNLNGKLEGNGMIGYGFLVGQQIYPGENLQVNGLANIDQIFSFSKLQFFSQVPKEAQVVVIVQGNLTGGQFNQQIGELSFFEKFTNGFKQALEYKEYNPRTINFLEGPMRNGKYINQAFFPLIIILLAIALLVYRFSVDSKNKRKAVGFGVGVLVFFWIFFDFFSTVNQVKIYKQIMSATNIMENGRVGRSSDFYQFLDFIKTKVPKGAQGFFIAPYPFDFEGKYHIYPDVKFNVITGVNYMFFYNPYGNQAPFDFKEPVYSGGILTWKEFTFSVQQEIVRQPYAKIYILKK
ncbi:MAG: hypothetical protein WC872_00465 [Candidatus Absconditabacterales bacterium]